MRATWKTPPTSFAYVAAPHLPIIHLAHGVAKKHFGEKTAIRSSFLFAEPKNDKFPIAKESDIKNLKYEVIFGASRFNGTKTETQIEILKRIESTLFELMRVLPNLVLFLGPVAFDTLFEALEKQKRKSITTAKPGIIVENFKRENNKWKRVQKHGNTSISVPLC
uniref:UDG domain-containing protein n=1 Tax=Caenorhabditis tropicalis TaxID=1561998 RepID=A0A1I7T4U6_9PELO